jgi:hypothetical protein
MPSSFGVGRSRFGRSNAGGRSRTASLLPARVAFGFGAGFFATIVFHEPGVALCHLIGITPILSYSLQPVPPFGVPQVVSLAFWGGVWGIVFAFVERPLARSPLGYWAGAIAFSAVPTVVSWLVVAPLKGQPIAGGFAFPGVLLGPIANALWALGAAAFLTLSRRTVFRPS